jgi:hypothetical protein
MDYLSSLPDGLLTVIHCLVYQLGGVRSLLNLEATCKQLHREALCNKWRFEHPITAANPSFACQAVPGASYFSRWIAAHAHRIDALILDKLSLHNSTTRALCEQQGLTQIRSLAVKATVAETLKPLAGLTNLVQLRCDNLRAPSNQTADGGFVSLQPLRLLTALESLQLYNRSAVTSLSPLSSLSHLTHLHLSGTQTCVRTIAPLSCLGPSLLSFHWDGLTQPHMLSMAPVSCLTGLTSLTWKAKGVLRNGELQWTLSLCSFLLLVPD